MNRPCAFLRRRPLHGCFDALRTRLSASANALKSRVVFASCRRLAASRCQRPHTRVANLHSPPRGEHTPRCASSGWAHAANTRNPRTVRGSQHAQPPWVGDHDARPRDGHTLQVRGSLEPLEAPNARNPHPCGSGTTMRAVSDLSQPTPSWARRERRREWPADQRHFDRGLAHGR